MHSGEVGEVGEDMVLPLFAPTPSSCAPSSAEKVVPAFSPNVGISCSCPISGARKDQGQASPKLLLVVKAKD